jgi:hypothetical protein
VTNHIIDQAAETLAGTVSTIVEQLATDTGLPPNAVLALLLKQTGIIVRSVDNRAGRWRFRVFIYSADKPNEVLADSDPEYPLGELGANVAIGLPGVAEETAMLCGAYHSAPCVGLDATTLRWRIKSLRPTLSRNHGRATWRIPYSTMEDGEPRQWLARVEIQKETGQ